MFSAISPIPQTLLAPLCNLRDSAWQSLLFQGPVSCWPSVSYQLGSIYWYPFHLYWATSKGILICSLGRMSISQSFPTNHVNPANLRMLVVYKSINSPVHLIYVQSFHVQRRTFWSSLLKYRRRAKFPLSETKEQNSQVQGSFAASQKTSSQCQCLITTSHPLLPK